MARRKRRTKAQIRKDNLIDAILSPWLLAGRVLFNVFVTIPLGLAIGAITGTVFMVSGVGAIFFLVAFAAAVLGF